LDDGIVVVRGSGTGPESERIVRTRVPGGLAVRLGPDAAKGLVEMFDAERQDWSDVVLTTVSERFERRLTEEVATLRVEIATLGGHLRQEFAKDRFELLKWMFVFWIGQLAAMSAIMSFMLHK
jgi:hypothetical protein